MSEYMYNQNDQSFEDLKLIYWIIDLSNGYGIAYQLLQRNKTDYNNDRVLRSFIRWYARLTPMQRKELSLY